MFFRNTMGFNFLYFDAESAEESEKSLWQISEKFVRYSILGYDSVCGDLIERLLESYRKDWHKNLA